jgi:DNA polymerase-3 subunit chi
MTDIWFYQLRSGSLETALPLLLERALARGWRVVIEAPDDARAAAIDSLLWTYSDESFLAHGRPAEGDPDLQPIWITTGDDNPNGARIRFFIGGAALRPEPDAGYERMILLFDGGDDAELASARRQWRSLRDLGASLSYWRQDEEGRWTKMD